MALDRVQAIIAAYDVSYAPKATNYYAQDFPARVNVGITFPIHRPATTIEARFCTPQNYGW